MTASIACIWVIKVSVYSVRKKKTFEMQCETVHR